MILGMKDAKLTKAEIIGVIGERTGYPASEIASVINETFSVLSDALAEGRTAELRGFGTFEVRTRKGREGGEEPEGRGEGRGGFARRCRVPPRKGSEGCRLGHHGRRRSLKRPVQGTPPENGKRAFSIPGNRCFVMPLCERITAISEGGQ